MTEHEMKRYADQPEMMALIQAVLLYDLQSEVMDGEVRSSPKRTMEEWLIRAAEIISAFTERQRKDDIRELLKRVETGDVELVFDGEEVD
jgi:hypothetical protein